MATRCSPPIPMWHGGGERSFRSCPEAGQVFEHYALSFRENHDAPTFKLAMFFMRLKSPCKDNLIWNILEAPTVTSSNPSCIRQSLRRNRFARAGPGFHPHRSDPTLPTDAGNLAWDAMLFFKKQKFVTASAYISRTESPRRGLAVGSGNAATTMPRPQRIFGKTAFGEALSEIAQHLGSTSRFSATNRLGIAGRANSRSIFFSA